MTYEEAYGTDDLKVRVRESARSASGRTADQVLGAEALADRYGVPAAVAGRNMDDLKRRAEVDDMAALVDTNPRLAEWFADDPDAVAVARDDVGPLSQLETMLAFSNPFTAGVAIADQVTGAGLARPAVDVLGSLTQGIGQPIGTAVSGAGALLDVGARGIDRNVRGLFGDDIADLFWFDGPRYANPANILNDLGEGVESVTNAGAPPEERQNLVTDVVSGLGQVTTYAAVTAATGGTGGLALGAGQGADIQADRARDAGTYGTVASDAAIIGGAAITSVTERLGLKWLFRQLPKSVQAGMQRKVADILLAGAGEATQEITEGVAQDAVTKALVDSEYEMFRGLDREALAAGGVGLIVRSMLHVGRGRMDSEQAKNERGEIAEVGRLVDSMGLAAKDPGRLKAALARFKTAGWNDVYVPVTSWQELFQSPQEADAARAAAGVSDSDYAAAVLSGGKLRVPTEGFYTGLTPEQRKPLYEVARRSADGMTPAEADGYDPDAAMAEFMEAVGAEGRPAGDVSNQVYDDFRLQLERAGASPDVASAQAEQLAAFVRTQSARSGVRIDAGRLAVVAQMDPRLQAVLRGPRAEPALDALIAGARSGRVFNEREVQGMRLVSLLVKMGGINPEAAGAGDLKAMDAQKLRPGLLNLAGMTLDDALQAARDEGYITTPLSNEGEVYDGNAPDINSLLEMISGDLSGMDPVYAPESLNMDRASFNEGVAALNDELQAKGISAEMLAEMSDAQVREALGFGPAVGAVSEDGEVLDQTAYHGTPHNVDRFSLQKIGTGEGAQAFGWGLYFASLKELAQVYRRKLTGADGSAVASPDQSIQLQIGRLQQKIKELQADSGNPSAPAMIRAYEARIAEIDAVGNLYKVEIPDDTDLLDYDKPLSEQPEKVRAAVERIMASDAIDADTRAMLQEQLAGASGLTGGQFYKTASTSFNLDGPKGLSELLLAEGVPGLRYLDAQGRVGTGSDSANYVIWDEAAISEPVSLYQSAVPQIDLTPSTRTRRITAGPSSLTYAVQDGVAKIVLVRTPRESRGQGGARAVMSQFLAATDAAGLPVTLTVAEQDSTTDAGRLALFYESMGFVRGDGDSMSRAVGAGPVAAADQTQTPEFKAWFGDSKVVDADGRPLVVYHGTGVNYGNTGQKIGGDFNSFDGSLSGQSSKTGAPESSFFFTNDPVVASSYTVKWRGDFSESAKENAQVIPVYLAIKKPLKVSAKGENWRNVEYKGETYDVNELAALAKEAGRYDGLIVTRVMDHGVGKTHGKTATTYVAFTPTQIKSAIGNRGTFDPNDPSILNQQGGSNPRGSITIKPSRYPGGVRTFLIKLGEKRDFSTFLHESAHFYLEILREIDAELRAADPAGLTPDQKKVLADHDALLAQLGVPDFDSITVKQHEAFAETFEAYLREGKAPSVRLARAFQKFGTWLKMVYRSIRNLPNQQLNDEVRGIFDRMLATDDEIDAARSAQSLGALFATPEAAGMTPDEFAQYQEALRVARDSAVTGEAAEQYRFEVAETRRWRTEEMARIRAEVAVDVDASPGMRAKYLLRAGTLPDGSALPAGQSPIKLNTTVVTDKYGKEWVKRNLAFMTSGEGVHPDLAAPLLGFKDGEALLAALANTPSRAAAIKAEADARWRDRHPDPMTDGELSDRVQARVHNDAQAEVMIREIAQLNARAGRDPGRPNVLAVMKAAAERITSAQRVGSLNPGQYRTTEAKAGRDALKAAAAGKWDEAVSARRRQLFAGIMYRAALDAKERAEGVRDKMVKLAKKPAQERFARAGWESYLERVNDILHAFDVRRLSEKEMGRRRSMRAWVEAQQEAGDVTAITDDLIARVEAQSVLNWRNATVAELDAAGDALTNIEHLARLKNKLLAGARAAQKEEAIEELLARAASVLPDAVERPVSRADLSPGQRVVRAVEAKRDEVTRPENMIEALDGGESGPWHDFIWSAMESAELKMVALRRDLGAKLKALRTEMPNDVVSLLGEPVTVFGVPTTRASLIGAVLNTGNAGNLQRLRDGGIAFNDRKLRLTDAQVNELRGMLTAAELRYVQGLWTAVNSMWGDIVALQRAMSGLPPEKVEAQAFTVMSADGVRMDLEGGYWPLAYDRDRSAVGENQSGEDALRVMMGQGFTKAATPKGYQKARVAEFEAPLQLDFGAVLSRHMDQVMTDIAYRAAVRDVMGLLNDQRVKESILAKLGRPAYDSLRGMVSYSVSGSSRVAGTAASGWQNLADGILSNMTVSALAIRPDIALGNYTSAMVQGLDRTGVRALLRGLWATYTPGRGDMTAEVKRLSPFMAERLDETDFIYQQELARTRRERGLGAAYKRVMMSLHRGADHEVTRALWWGKFQNEIDGGATQAEAVRLADKAIRQTQTAVGRKDLSTFERDPAFRQSRQFMGPMFVIFGRLNAAARGQGATRTIGPRVATVMLQVFMAPALFALMAGRWPEDGDDEDDEIGVNEWSIWLAANTAMFPLQTLPFLRDVGSGIESALTGNPINPRAAPVSAAGANIIKAGKSIWDNLEEYQETGEMDWYDMTRDLTTMAAPFVAAPASQVRQTTRALEAFRDNPDAGALEMTSMAVYGKMPPTSSE